MAITTQDIHRAADEIAEAGGKHLTISEMVKKHPSGAGIKIMR